MPLPMVSRLKLPLGRKIKIAGDFLLRTMVVVVSITRMVMYIRVGTTFREHYNDMALDYTSPVFFWTNIKISLAVILACLPTLRPLWTVLSSQSRRASKASSNSKSNLHRPYDELKHDDCSRERERERERERRILEGKKQPTLDTLDRLESFTLGVDGNRRSGAGW
ncbi:hypothetical protein ASPCAL08371 [Aspergillus calidoustus]|uniref:Rhodopsin domain-containing protein n=1 Tax=Aspergillus calidoustus TaxID=454130 RepID=A0A0U5A0K6_ASPCI|nr:hypothetical protein ASPCAL08371 [Aspergillus calidoustus]